MTLMTSRTNLKQQLIRQQLQLNSNGSVVAPSLLPQSAAAAAAAPSGASAAGETAISMTPMSTVPAASPAQKLIITSCLPASSLQFVGPWSTNSGIISVSAPSGQFSAFRLLENPTPFHLAQQQQQQQQQVAPSSTGTRVARSPCQLSPLSPNSLNSVASASELYQPIDELDIDLNLIEPTFTPLSSTVPVTVGSGFGSAVSPAQLAVGRAAPDDPDDEDDEDDDEDDAGVVGDLGGGRLPAGSTRRLVKASTSAPAGCVDLLLASPLPASRSTGLACLLEHGCSGDTATAGAAASSSASTVPSPGGVSSNRERCKKDSHNRIERKRRENINHQISELGDCIPRGWFKESDLKKNKGNILKASVDYIRDMQTQNVRLQERLDLAADRQKKVEQLNRELFVRMQDLHNVMVANGIAQSDDGDTDLIRELLCVLSTSTSGAATSDQVMGQQQQQQQQQQTVKQEPIVISCDSDDPMQEDSSEPAAC